MLQKKAIALALAAFALGGAAASEAAVLRWAHSTDISSADPYGRREDFTLSVLGNVYEGLVRWNDRQQLEPALAESWEIVEPTRWRFHLRRGVKFHNGNAFDADDVVFSFQRATAPKSNFKGLLEPVREVRKVDDHTVDLVLKAPHAILLNDLAGWFIMDREWCIEHGAAEPIDLASAEQKAYTANHANGTGPFMLKSREPDVSIVAVANPGWWDTPRHNLSEVVYTPIRSDATRVAALLSGQLDFIRGVPLADVPRLEQNPDIRMLEGPHARVVFLGMNARDPELKSSDVRGRNPFADIRVRTALYQAINEDAIKKSVMRGRARPAAIAVAPQTHGYDASLDVRLPYDPEVAKALLAEAGYPNGFAVELGCPNNGSLINDEQICQALVAMLGKVGVRVSLRAQPSTQHYGALLKGELDMWMLGWASLPAGDVSALFTAVVHSPNGSLGAYNPKGWSDPGLDALITQVGTEYDPGKRQALISEALRRHREAVAVLPLHQQQLTWAARKGFTVPQPADEYVRWWTVTGPK